MPDWLIPSWYILICATGVALSFLASAHIILNKRDNQSAIGWVSVVWLAPFTGSVLYYLLGINRVARKAKRLKRRRDQRKTCTVESPKFEPNTLPAYAAHLGPHARLVHDLAGVPLLAGNAVVPFYNGTDAYTAMLAAIDAATHTIGLSTYIFDKDAAGQRFIDALGRAALRGVEVRVLLDDIGVRYSLPSTVISPLRNAGVQVALFLPQLLPWHFHYANLRNHRKLLIVDGKIGFTGGMNIRAAHDPNLQSKSPIADLHFRLEGPVVAHLRDTFAADWEFSECTALHGHKWFPKLQECGGVLARGIRFGPDDNFLRLRTVYLGALASARTSVRIVTPYFLPDTALIAGLNVAAHRGITVDIILPQRNNLRMIHWACMGQIGQVLEHRCRVWLDPPPFAHTKLLIVDRTWVLFGSSNWDPRSFRLNFEFDVECYDSPLVSVLDDFVAKKISRSRELTLAELNQRSLASKLRDGAARLLTPYL